MTTPPVPVLVVAGYLGSGKTTLLNHLLRSSRSCGSQIGVLVNDFGAVNIDALLVAGQADSTVSLGGGCVCCAVDRDGLGQALSSLVRPSAQLDAIVIEASGIAEPKALIRMVTGISDTRMRYGGLIYVVDAAHLDDVRDLHPELDGHVGIADLVVLNKVDLVEDATTARIAGLLRQLNPSAPVVTAKNAAIAPALLFDTAERGHQDPSRAVQLTLDALLADDAPHDDGPHGDHPHGHLHADYQSISFESDRPMSPRRLAAFLERPPHGSFRIKGITHFDSAPAHTGLHRQKYVVHSVGGFVRVGREPWAGDPASTTFVVIGSGLDPGSVRDALTQALAGPDDEADENGILSILRYVLD